MHSVNIYWVNLAPYLVQISHTNQPVTLASVTVDIVYFNNIKLTLSNESSCILYLQLQTVVEGLDTLIIGMNVMVIFDV